MESIKTCAVIILYNPKQDLSHLLRIAAQVDVCVLVDNSEKSVLNENNFPSNIIYHANNDNIGIAGAQNIGVEIARNNGGDFVIFFDQDSEPDSKLVNELVRSYLFLDLKCERIGLIGPRAFNKTTQKKYYHRDRDHRNIVRKTYNRYTSVDYTLSSGSLMPIKIFDEVGLFNESLFIDSVDHDFCWRLKNKSYDIFIDEDVGLPHMLGENQIKVMKIRINVPSPIRHYYVFRNWCFMFRAPHVSLKFKIRLAKTFIFKAIFFSLFVSPRMKRSRYIIKGLYDGILGRYGKIK